MGLRLEIVQIFLIVLTVTLALTNRIHQKSSRFEQATRELEFRDTTLIEVTTAKREGIAYAAFGVRENGIVTLEQMQYRNENIALMRADRARYEDQVIYFEGNVTLLHKKGLRFFTEQADYDKHSERIDVTAPFVAYVDRNRIRGSRMQFWLDSEEVYAEHIQAEVVIQHGNVARKGEEQ